MNELARADPRLPDEPVLLRLIEEGEHHGDVHSGALSEHVQPEAAPNDTRRLQQRHAGGRQLRQPTTEHRDRVRLDPRGRHRHVVAGGRQEFSGKQHVAAGALDQTTEATGGHVLAGQLQRQLGELVRVERRHAECAGPSEHAGDPAGRSGLLASCCHQPDGQRAQRGGELLEHTQ